MAVDFPDSGKDFDQEREGRIRLPGLIHFKPLTKDAIQGRLFSLAAIFLAVYSVALTLSPSVIARSWDVAYRWNHWLGFFTWIVLAMLIHRQSSHRLPTRDPYLLPVAFLLTGWGLLTVWRLYPGFGLRQTVWLILSGTVLIAGMSYPDLLQFLRRYKYLWVTSGLVLTALTLIFGTNPTPGGPPMWLGCCGIYLQPSEPLKLLLIVYLAAYLAGEIGDGKGRLRLPPARLSLNLLSLLAPTLVVTGLALALLAVQRDLGTASIFIFLYTIIIYVTTGKKRTLAIGALFIGLAGLAGYLLFDVVRVRIDAWVNPWLDPSGRSYQIVQSLIAIANGGILGRGPGLGSPGLVPVPHSDFIFSSITEESGLAGALGLLLLLAVLAERGLQIAFHATDSYRRYLALGLTTYLVAQSVLIIGGNLRLLPLTGVTLPFVSYGGSSLLTAIVSLMLLVIISNTGENRPAILPNPRPYYQLGVLLFAGIAATGLLAGWWATVRADALVSRTDNPRRAIADRYVQRGAILDRYGNALAVSLGSPGNYSRQIEYPALSSILGYTNYIFGQAGLEASIDPYLRGLAGNPGLTIWSNHLIFGQPPPGVDVRLSIDLELQKQADDQLGSHPGAVVLLDAGSGEILAMASHPTFNANELEQSWEELINAEDTPLVNRTTQGLYPPGTALGPILLGYASAYQLLPNLPNDLSYAVDGMKLNCVVPPENVSWSALISSGCPGAATALGESLGSASLREIFTDLGLFVSPLVQLPSADPVSPQADQSAAEMAVGSGLQVTPLHMALTAAALSNQGTVPAAKLLLAVEESETGWTPVSALQQPREVLPEAQANAIANALTASEQPFWQTLSVTPNGPDRTVTWFLGGMQQNAGEQPLAIAVLLEEDNPVLAEHIGMALLTGAMLR